MVRQIEVNRERIIALCRRYGVQHLELFGSATGIEFDPESSDMDFLVEFEPSTPCEHADCYFGLLQALEDLFGRQVDLVERRAISNPYFLAGIGKSRQMIYAG